MVLPLVMLERCRRPRRVAGYSKATSSVSGLDRKGKALCSLNQGALISPQPILTKDITGGFAVT